MTESFPARAAELALGLGRAAGVLAQLITTPAGHRIEVPLAGASADVTVAALEVAATADRFGSRGRFLWAEVDHAVHVKPS